MSKMSKHERLRGYAAIGLHMPKTPANVGSVIVFVEQIR